MSFIFLFFIFLQRSTNNQLQWAVETRGQLAAQTFFQFDYLTLPGRDFEAESAKCFTE